MKRRAIRRDCMAAAVFGAALLSLTPCVAAAQPAATPGGAAESAPSASEIRLAGDAKQTRFIVDLDRTVTMRAFPLADPYRVVVDLPQINFRLPAGIGQTGRGLVKAYRYGLVMPGASRIVLDLTGPAKIEKAYVLPAANDQPARLVIELAATDPTGFVQSLAPAARPELRPAVEVQATGTVAPSPPPAASGDLRPIVVIDPGHGGIDNGTQAASGELEKALVLDFALALRERIEKAGRYRVVMTRSDDTFVPLGERVKLARAQSAALFISVHADALPSREGDARGATIYTLSDKASDAEAERLADAENKADAIAGVNLTEEPDDVADILIDLVQRETKTFSNRFARTVMGEMKTAARLHKQPLKSAGFKVLKAPDVPSVLIELGYVSNKDDLKQLVSEDWRARTVGAVAKAVDVFLGKRLSAAGSSAPN